MIKFFVLFFSFLQIDFARANLPLNISEEPKEWTNLQVEEMLGDNRNSPLVAIGDTVHGSQKFTQAQTRIIKYLVEFKGYRNIYLEDRVFYLDPLTEWVRNGTGDINLIIHEMYWENISTEMLDKLLFLRSWNLSHPDDKVELLPIDVHIVHPAKLNAKIKSILLKLNEVASLNKVIDAEKNCIGHDVADYDNYIALEKKIKEGSVNISDSNYNLCLSSFNEVLSDIKNKKSQIISNYGKDNFSDLIILLQTLPSKQAFYKFILKKPRDIPEFTKVRDPIIADNLITRKEQLGNKNGIFLAHTLHVSKNALLADWGFGTGTLVSAGYYLNNYFKGNYKAIALTGYRVSTFGIAAGGYSYEIPTASNSIDNYLNINDFECTYFNSYAKFLNINQTWYVQNGNRIQDPNGILLNLKDHFDSLIFFRESKMSTRIPYPKK